MTSRSRWREIGHAVIIIVVTAVIACLAAIFVQQATAQEPIRVRNVVWLTAPVRCMDGIPLDRMKPLPSKGDHRFVLDMDGNQAVALMMTADFSRQSERCVVEVRWGGRGTCEERTAVLGIPARIKKRGEWIAHTVCRTIPAGKWKGKQEDCFGPWTVFLTNEHDIVLLDEKGERCRYVIEVVAQ